MPRLLRALVFSLTLGVAASSPARADFADSLAGGPDFWEVAGVRAGDALSLRKAPSPRAAKIRDLPNGTVLRNRGCRIAGAQRWCRVETARGAAAQGWVAGRYLRETGAPN